MIDLLKTNPDAATLTAYESGMARRIQGRPLPCGATRDLRIGYDYVADADEHAAVRGAFADGITDGLAWDLDGFESLERVRAETTGWDEATINGVGADACAERWDVEQDGDEWAAACEAYNAGAHLGACAPQQYRTGLPPRTQD